MMEQHVARDLSAFCHAELAEERARAVASHLERCARCRAEYDEVRFGVALAGHMERSTAPESLWGEVQTQLSNAPATPRLAFGWGRALAYAALALLALSASFQLWYTEFRDPLQMIVATAPPTEFEAAAREAHLRRLGGELQFDFVTASPEALRAWVLEHAGIHLDLATVRPLEDGNRFRVLGAKVMRAGGARAALVGYEIDAQPVTLLAAPIGEVADPPADPWFRKKISWRFDDQRGLKLVTWGARGDAYVLVSNLPGRGTDACLICHTGPAMRQLFRDVAEKPRT